LPLELGDLLDLLQYDLVSSFGEGCVMSEEARAIEQGSSYRKILPSAVDGCNAVSESSKAVVLLRAEDETYNPVLMKICSDTDSL
jgi:hypothetical protein